MPNNSLTLLIDETGVYYRVPICLINDPISYDKDYNAQKLANKARPDSATLELKVRNTTHGDLPMQAKNTSQVDSFKLEYIAKLKEDNKLPDDLKSSSIRMFAMGKEMKDSFYLYSYDITDGLTLMA